MLLSNYHNELWWWRYENTATAQLLKATNDIFFIFIVYLYLFLYFFLYYFYGLGSNVTNPADGEFLAFAIRMSLQAVNGFRISLLSTLFCYMWSSFASTALILNCFSCARALLRLRTWLYPISWKLDNRVINIIQLSRTIVR